MTFTSWKEPALSRRSRWRSYDVRLHRTIMIGLWKGLCVRRDTVRRYHGLVTEVHPTAPAESHPFVGQTCPHPSPFIACLFYIYISVSDPKFSCTEKKYVVHNECPC